ncbi:MAG: hypothetical protein VB878_00565, partial [Pirellulaceae bacterium]
PRQGTYGRPTTVLVPAGNSRAATNIALQRNPGYVFSGIRKINQRTRKRRFTSPGPCHSDVFK